jgi:hypothetical protein
MAVQLLPRPKVRPSAPSTRLDNPVRGPLSHSATSVVRWQAIFFDPSRFLFFSQLTQ